MKLLALVLTIFAVATPATGGTPPRASLPDVEDEVMCVECGTALNVSQSTVADQERAFIRRQIALGKDKAQIKAALVDQFGPGVLAMPQEKGFSLAAYLVPIGLAAAALLALILTARRWRRRPAAAPPAATAPLADEDARRLDAELAAYDRR
jgi:cytochrome c-type biogenesis protein CcmH